jgi:hypothetical protein
MQGLFKRKTNLEFWQRLDQAASTHRGYLELDPRARRPSDPGKNAMKPPAPSQAAAVSTASC